MLIIAILVLIEKTIDFADHPSSRSQLRSEVFEILNTRSCASLRAAKLDWIVGPRDINSKIVHFWQWESLQGPF